MKQPSAPCLMLAAAIAAANSTRAQTRGVTGDLSPPWSSSCQANECVLGGVIRDVDAPSEIDIEISMSISRSDGSIRQVSFRLPRYDRRKSFSIGFANTRKDSTGQWRMDLDKAATRVFKPDQCDEQGCAIVLSKGQFAGEAGNPAMNVGSQMLKSDMMMFIYFKNSDAMEASTALPGLQRAYRSVVGAAN